jgi:hypothetical protein
MMFASGVFALELFVITLRQSWLSPAGHPPIRDVVIGLVYLVLAILFVVAGFTVRRGRRRARWYACLLSGVSALCLGCAFGVRNSVGVVKGPTALPLSEAAGTSAFMDLATYGCTALLIATSLTAIGLLSTRSAMTYVGTEPSYGPAGIEPSSTGDPGGESVVVLVAFLLGMCAVASTCVLGYRLVERYRHVVSSLEHIDRWVAINLPAQFVLGGLLVFVSLVLVDRKLG